MNTEEKEKQRILQYLTAMLERAEDAPVIDVEIEKSGWFGGNCRVSIKFMRAPNDVVVIGRWLHDCRPVEVLTKAIEGEKEEK